jgi:hypothetical protein
MFEVLCLFQFFFDAACAVEVVYVRACPHLGIAHRFDESDNTHTHTHTHDEAIAVRS